VLLIKEADRTFLLSPFNSLLNQYGFTPLNFGLYFSCSVL